MNRSDAERSANVFRYRRPDLTREKAVIPLARSDLMFCAVQVIQRGGENNLHSHAHQDGFWFVLRGGARFYTDDDVLVSEVGPDEGVFIPRGYRYWFESIGDEPLELLQVEAFDHGMSAEEIFADRMDYTPKPEWMSDFNSRATEAQ